MILNNFVWQVIKKVTSSWTYLALLSFITLGALFVGLREVNNTYFNVFFLGISNNKFLILVMFPSFILLYLYVYNIINNYSNIIIRLENKSNYLKLNLKAMLGLSFIFFITIILIFLILTNLSSYLNGTIISTYFGYNVNDLVVIIVWLIKIYLTCLVFGLIVLLNIFIFNKASLSGLISFSYLGIILFSDNLFPTNKNFWFYFNPGFNVNGVFETTDIYFAIKTGIGFYLIVFLGLIYLLKKGVKKSRIGVMLK